MNIHVGPFSIPLLGVLCFAISLGLSLALFNRLMEGGYDLKQSGLRAGFTLAVLFMVSYRITKHYSKKKSR